MTGSKEHGLPIFHRLLISFFGVVFAAFCFTVMVIYVYSRKSLEEQTRERISQQFDSAVSQFQHEVVEDLSRDLRILKSSPVLDEFVMSSEVDREINARAVERLFLQSIKNTPGIIGINYLDSRGREQVRVERTGRIRESRDLGESEQFARIENGPPDSIHSGGLFRTRDGEVCFSIGIGKTDVDIGKFGGAVNIDYSFAAFFQELGAIRIIGENPIWVFAPDGQVLQRPSMKNAFDPRAYFQKETQDIPRYSDVSEGVFVYQDLSVNPGRPLLRVAISVPSALLLRDLRSIMGYLALVFVFSLAILSATVYLLAGYLSRPIVGLAAAAARLAKGDLSARVQVKTTGEVKMLVDSFNFLASDLQTTMVSKDYLDNIIKSMNDTLIVVARDGKITRINAAASALLGYRETELAGQPLAAILKGTSRDADSGIVDLVAQGSVSNVEKVYVNKDGSEIPVLFSAAGLRGGDGEIQGVVCVAQDITRRKLIEKQLQLERNRAQKYLDVAGVLLVVTDSDGKIRLVNRKGCEILGWSEAEVIGLDWFDSCIPERLRDDLRKVYRELMTGTSAVAEHVEHLVLTRNGEERIISWHNTVFKDEDGSVNGLSSGEDVTERRKLEAQLRHAQRMETIGTLAGGVAHDFNNILGAIIGFASLIQMKLQKDDLLQRYIQQILTSSERAAHLTRGLLAFSRKQIINPKPVDLNTIVKVVEQLISRLIREDIEFSLLLSPQPLTVLADSGQIEQVLINLATNARDAMPEGGRLTLSTELVVIGEDFIKAHGYGSAGIYALISVSDTGQGMDQKTQQRIFEPFFTTKEVGKGTGLGLAIVYGIVKQHGGYVNCYSEPLIGTTFNIYLPLTEEQARQVVTVLPPGVCGGTETILIAEDDEHLRNLAFEVLTQYGYTVFAAADGEQAVRLYQENKDRIDLLILDVIMPKKNGREVYDAIRAICPRIKALFTSGYTANIIHKKGVLEEGVNFIPKPVAPYVLLRKVRELLDGDRTGAG